MRLAAEHHGGRTGLERRQRGGLDVGGPVPYVNTVEQSVFTPPSSDAFFISFDPCIPCIPWPFFV